MGADATRFARARFLSAGKRGAHSPLIVCPVTSVAALQVEKRPISSTEIEWRKNGEGMKKQRQIGPIPLQALREEEMND
jgi:hypothetical protein